MEFELVESTHSWLPDVQRVAGGDRCGGFWLDSHYAPSLEEPRESVELSLATSGLNCASGRSTERDEKERR